MSETTWAGAKDRPIHRYKYTLTVWGDSHDEIEAEVLHQVNGGYELDSDHHRRDAFRVISGRTMSFLEHINPDQTPENYARQLKAWNEQRRLGGGNNDSN